ncbi:hypothetical protein HK096_008865 [Nowakowskiella sp. JEL0078]|nr:hypothetical protein HK096_008865 [Nowakowskiella sp. JEL0078]
MGFSLDTPVDLIRRRLPIGQTDFNYVNNELTFTLPNFDQLYSNDFAYEQHLPLTSNGSAFEVITCSYSSPFPITISPCEQQMIWEDNNADFEPQAPGIWLENSPRSLITSICKNDLVSDIGSQQNLISRINFAQITPNETHFFNAEPDTSFSQSPIFPEQTDTVSQIYSQPFDRIDENLNLFTFDSFSESINSLLKIPKAASLFQVIPDQISSIDLQLLLKSKLMAKHNPFQFSLIEENEEILSSPLITPAWTIQGPCQCSQTAVNETVNVPNELSPQITKSDMSGTERAHDCINDLENTVCKKAYCLPLRGRRSGGKYMEKSESSRDVGKHFVVLKVFESNLMLKIFSLAVHVFLQLLSPEKLITHVI